MKGHRRALSAARPWAGLLLGLPAMIGVHQFGADFSFDHCATAAPIPIVAAVVLGVALCSLAALLSWRDLRSRIAARRLVSAMSIGLAALFAFAMVLPLIAAFALPPCFR